MTGGNSVGEAPDAVRVRFARTLRLDWLGQTVASVCWILSVLADGVGSTGDWLQLLAGTSWLMANVASLVTSGD